MQLETEAAVVRSMGLAGAIASREPTRPPSAPPVAHTENPSEAEALSDNSDSQLLEDCSAEHFVQKLRELSLATTPDPAGLGLPNPGLPATLEPSYTYSRLKFDVLSASSFLS